jgi:hypothetical protein
MVLHAHERYPLLKFLLDELSGSFFENELTWLNRLVILYHNRKTLSIRDDHDRFLQDFISKNKNSSLFDILRSRATRKSMRTTRERLDYLLKNNLGLIEYFLQRDDCGLPKAKYETIAQIFDWLQSLPYDFDPQTDLDLNAWKQEIRVRYSPILDRAVSESSINMALRPDPEVRRFSDILTGVDPQERETKFKKLLTYLTEASWIAAADESGKFQFRKAAHGGRLWIAALYYALYQKQHIKDSQTASAVAGLFNTWLIHPFSKESFEKVFQPEEQSKFAGKGNHQRARYAQECFLLIQNL